MSRRIPRALLALCCLALGLGMAIDVAGQDPRGTAAQGAAREWLKQTDANDAKTSWDAAGKQFQASLTLAQWGEQLQKVRMPFGALVTRTMVSTQFRQGLPGARDGQYAMVLFQTNFANKSEAVETLMLERETDGAWRVIGYLIR